MCMRVRLGRRRWYCAPWPLPGSRMCPYAASLRPVCAGEDIFVEIDLDEQVEAEDEEVSGLSAPSPPSRLLAMLPRVRRLSAACRLRLLQPQCCAAGRIALLTCVCVAQEEEEEEEDEDFSALPVLFTVTVSKVPHWGRRLGALRVDGNAMQGAKRRQTALPQAPNAPPLLALKACTRNNTPMAARRPPRNPPPGPPRATP